MILFVVGWMFAAQNVSSEVIYNNTSNRESPELFSQSTGYQFGDEITIASGNSYGYRFITNFVLEYYLTGVVDMNNQMRLRFYANDGVAYGTNNNGSTFYAPGTVLFDSDFFSIGGGNFTLAFNGADDFGAAKGVLVPSNFTWTVEFNNIGVGENAGLALYNPPTVGASEPDYWEQTGGVWGLNSTNGSYPNPLNFGAYAEAAIDTYIPTCKIVSPLDKVRSYDSTITVAGTATDEGGIALVLYRLGHELYGTNNFTPASGMTAWGVTNLALRPGTNYFQVKSVDTSGNESPLVNRKYSYVVTNQLTVIKLNSGTLDPDHNGEWLEINRNYSMKATAGNNYVFSNWLASVDGGPTTVATNSPTITFRMQTNMLLTADFETNQFIGAAGNYYGLFWDTNAGVAHPSAGFFTLKTDSKQKFSGSVNVDGNKVGFTGLLGLDGTGTSVLKATASKPYPNNRNKFGKSPVYVTVALDLNGNDTVTGTVTNVDWGTNEVWTSTLTGDRVVFSKVLLDCTNYAGSYTLMIPGTNAVGSPAGDSYAVVTVASNGTVKATGALAEGAGSKALKLKPLATSISKNGDWPFYASAYLEARIVAGKTIKEYQGALMGWLAFTGDQYATNRDLTGTVVWMKPGWTNTFYTGGFTNAVEVAGSAYVSPVDGVRALDVPSDTATAVHTGGNLTAQFQNQFSWLAVLKKSNKLTGINPRYGEKTLAVTAKSGLVKGTFLHPDNANLKTAVAGVLLQDDKVGRGFFLGTNASGSFLLQGD